MLCTLADLLFELDMYNCMASVVASAWKFLSHICNRSDRRLRSPGRVVCRIWNLIRWMGSIQLEGTRKSWRGEIVPRKANFVCFRLPSQLRLRPRSPSTLALEGSSSLTTGYNPTHFLAISPFAVWFPGFPPCLRHFFLGGIWRFGANGSLLGCKRCKRNDEPHSSLTHNALDFSSKREKKLYLRYLWYTKYGFRRKRGSDLCMRRMGTWTARSSSWPNILDRRKWEDVWHGCEMIATNCEALLQMNVLRKEFNYNPPYAIMHMVRMVRRPSDSFLHVNFWRQIRTAFWGSHTCLQSHTLISQYQ